MSSAIKLGKRFQGYEQLYLFENRGYKQQQHNSRSQTMLLANILLKPMWLEQTKAFKTPNSKKQEELIMPVLYGKFELVVCSGINVPYVPSGVPY